MNVDENSKDKLKEILYETNELESWEDEPALCVCVCVCVCLCVGRGEMGGGGGGMLAGSIKNGYNLPQSTFHGPSFHRSDTRYVVWLYGQNFYQYQKVTSYRVRDDPYWISSENSLQLIELSSINKVSLV